MERHEKGAMGMGYDITVIGAAIIDILALPVNESVFSAGSIPMETIQMSFGGDALNETVILSSFGKKVQLISKVGDDEAGKRVLGFLQEKGISVDCIRVQKELATGINIVLIDEKGERHFLTNPHSSLRKLDLEDVQAFVDDTAAIISFASVFVSPLMTIPKMKELFSSIKEKGKVLAVDMTKLRSFCHILIICFLMKQRFLFLQENRILIVMQKYYSVWV